MPENELRDETDVFPRGHDIRSLACGNGDFVRRKPLGHA